MRMPSAAACSRTVSAYMAVTVSSSRGSMRSKLNWQQSRPSSLTMRSQRCGSGQRLTAKQALMPRCKFGMMTFPPFHCLWLLRGGGQRAKAGIAFGVEIGQGGFWFVAATDANAAAHRLFQRGIEANGGRGHEGGAERGGIRGHSDHRHAGHIGLDLVPEIDAGTAAGDMDLAYRRARFGHNLQIFTHGEGHAFEDGSRQVAAFMAQGEADEAAAQGRIEAFAIGHIGQEDQASRARRGLTRGSLAFGEERRAARRGEQGCQPLKGRTT